MLSKKTLGLIALVLIEFIIITGLITPKLFLSFFKKVKNMDLNKPRGTNVVLITFDALRSDRVGAYGYNRNTTPNIDEFSRDSVLFKEAIAQSTWTLPSLSSLMTSRYPSNIGMLDYNSAIPEEIETLPKILSKRGYKTFALYDQVYASVVAHGIFRKSNYVSKGNYNFSKRMAHSAAQIIRENNDSSFFLWAHFLYPHCAPYRLPEPFLGLYANHSKECICKNLGICDEDVRSSYYSNVYDERVKYIDQQFGRILRSLKEQNLYNESLIIISADHGEGLGEHGIWKHNEEPYDEQIHVPLVIKFPNREFSGKVIERQVRLIDLIPTVLDFLGLSRSPSSEGTSLLPIVNNESLERLPAVSEKKNWVSIRTQKWKYIEGRNGSSRELYNLKKDPDEKNNLINEKPRVATRLKERLNLALGGRSTRKRRRNLTEEMRKRLKKLGYLG